MGKKLLKGKKKVHHKRVINLQTAQPSPFPILEQMVNELMERNGRGGE